MMMQEQEKGWFLSFFFGFSAFSKNRKKKRTRRMRRERGRVGLAVIRGQLPLAHSKQRWILNLTELDEERAQRFFEVLVRSVALRYQRTLVPFSQTQNVRSPPNEM